MSFPIQLNTSIHDLHLVQPDVERDAPIAVEWLSGKTGEETLLAMGMPPNKISEPSLEAEKERVQGFLQKDNQLNWMIRFKDRIVGAVWVDLEHSSHIEAPSLHIMIGDTTVRGQGVGLETCVTVIQYLKREREAMAVFSRHLTSNKESAQLLLQAGFAKDGNPYKDEDGLEWQNLSKGL